MRDVHSLRGEVLKERNVVQADTKKNIAVLAAVSDFLPQLDSTQHSCNIK
jgi:hypothetical protein